MISILKDIGFHLISGYCVIVELKAVYSYGTSDMIKFSERISNYKIKISHINRRLLRLIILIVCSFLGIYEIGFCFYKLL